MNRHLKRLYDSLPIRAQDFMLTAFSARLHLERYGSPFSEFRNLLEESQWWDSGRMLEWQNERLRGVVCHCYANVPYYRQLFDERGLTPQDVQTLADLRKLPVLSRDTLRRRLPDLVARRLPGRMLEGHTSGTTGTPLTVFYDRAMVRMNYAALDRQYRWAGIRMATRGDRVAVIRGNIIVPLDQHRPPFHRVNHLHNQLLLSNFHLAPVNLPCYFEALRAYRAVALDGYPSSVYVLAHGLLALGQRLPLKAVLTSSETLYDFQRATIEEAFQCRVFDYFGAAERVIFAAECERHQGHHLCSEYGITEVLDERDEPVGRGEEGYLVGTTLHNLALPLLRYRSSDRSALKSDTCACGRGLPLMEDVTTKAEDMLRLPDGRIISPSVLTHPFKPLHTVEASQLVQTHLDRLLVRVVPGDGYTLRDTQHLVTELQSRLGPDMRVEVELVQELPRSPAGKFKWVIGLPPLPEGTPPGSARPGHGGTRARSNPGS